MRAGDFAELAVVEVIAHAPATSAESPQRDRPAERSRVESVVEAAGLFDHVSFRFVEADIIELAAIGAERQLPLIGERNPFTPEPLPFRRQQERVLRFRIRGQVNLVEMIPPMPTVDAKSAPPSLNST